MKNRVIVALMLASVIFPNLSAAGDVIIIANPSVAVSHFSQKDISNIFLGKKTNWKDDSKIVFVVQRNSDVHKAFLKNYVHKSPSQFDRYWKKLIFTGKGALPKSFESEQALIKYVGETKGAIGYVSAKSNRVNVKTIRVE